MLTLSMLISLSIDAQGIMRSGVIKFQFSSFNKSDTVFLSTPEVKKCGNIFIDPNTGIFSCKINNIILKENSIIARYCFPDYNILVLDCIDANKDRYKVLINGQVYLIDNPKNKTKFKYLSWQNFIKEYIINPDEKAPIYFDTINKKIVPEYEKYTFKAIKFSGDWCLVECFGACDEKCPQIPIKGWIKWRYCNNLLLDLRFEC